MNTILQAEPETAARYHALGLWGTLGVADYVRRNAENFPECDAIITEHARVSWADYDREVDRIAGILGTILDRNERFGVYLPDCPEFHYALCAAERSGTIAVGAGARSDKAELLYLLTKSDARVLVMRAEHRGESAQSIAQSLSDGGHALETLILCGAGGEVRVVQWQHGEFSEVTIEPAPAEVLAARAFSPDEVSMLNSTSGTTGRPKLVTQTANRWINFTQIAIEDGEFTDRDVILGAVPGPFGFGLWTAHYAPAMLGVPVVLMESFSVQRMIDFIEDERVTVLACVSTQFKMMLDAPELATADVQSLRVMYTGGEAVPYERAREFEERVDARVLQFYGSNEGGAVTNTTLRDTAEQRLRTAGRVSPGATIRLLDSAGNDVTETGGPGQPAVTGPSTTYGYFNDDAANAELFKNGQLLMPDIVTVDADGYYKIVGRTSDLIIRGGKNISAVEVEEAVEGHPEIIMAAAVPVPDELFGERIGVAVKLAADSPLALEQLVEYLVSVGCSKSLLPERMLVVDDLPLAPGGKIAKGKVKELFTVGSR
ncbi:class I adenylate-forming enzyme family protein [Glaciibacter psychrotolerans]|uniref:Acyl-CoA synthetase n=1 Tax=Glaciibacter psychrotolerans TaxID=670054 RepID=A0A7Z0EF00_9MICO|nr:class I adenylate-forming enzyme family protein [Leifsonia psychrotolerans]NYJ20442.1 acyl-CoA synthetase [Leifsonia psychrotolerans]